MKLRLSKIANTYFGGELDLRVRLFNALAVAGCVGSFLTGTISLFSGAGFWTVAMVYTASVLSAALIVYASRTQHYQPCYFITIAAVFIGFFSYLFVNSGGYYGGISLYFVFAVVFTIFMLDGKAVLIATAAELAVYAALFFYAYRQPQSIVPYSDEWGYFINNLGDLFIVSIALGATMHAQVCLYRAQQRRVDEQNAVLAQANRAKTQFLANTSHEMRTPLTVASVNIQTVMGLLKRTDSPSDCAKAQALLRDAQAEIMRLSRMVGGMLSLNSIADTSERAKIDLTALLHSTAEMMRLLLGRNQNALELDIEPGLAVFCSADLLSQVIVNLLQNSNAHTKGGVLSLSAAACGGEITVSVRDNGSGIAPELLPHVFERNVTDGGTGVGLFLCKAVVESHGGSIRIQSARDVGTTVTFALPVYQGQYGGQQV